MRRFGSEASLVAGLADGDNSLLQPLSSESHSRVLGVEVLWAQQAEGALNIEDVLERRTRISLVPGDSALVNETVSALLDKATMTAH